MCLISAATFEGWSLHIYPLTSCDDDDDECSNNMHHMSDAAAAAPSLAIYVNTTLQLENVPRLAFSSNPVNNLTNTTLPCTGLVFVSLVTNIRVVHFYQQQQTSYLFTFQLFRVVLRFTAHDKKETVMRFAQNCCFLLSLRLSLPVFRFILASVHQS